MTLPVLDRQDQYVLNQCGKYLARDNADNRHNFGQYATDDPRGSIAEVWRFPVIDAYWDGESAAASYAFNAVTFVYRAAAARPGSVAVVGTFGDLSTPIPLRPIRFAGEDTELSAVTVRVPKGQVHTYKYIVDGQVLADPVNPQRTVLDNGQEWSRFFTDACQVPLELNRRERAVLERLVAHLLPFRLEENSLFVRSVYDRLDRARRGGEFPLAYRLDEEVGVVNYIDKIISREERQNARAYHTCLDIIDRLLRARSGGAEPASLPIEFYTDLYAQMETDQVAGWDQDRFASPRYFLLLLRRHAITGAFVHPRHGGNSGAAGWMYLESRYRGPDGTTLFDWRRAVEQPLGDSTDYRG